MFAGCATASDARKGKPAAAPAPTPVASGAPAPDERVHEAGIPEAKLSEHDGEPGYGVETTHLSEKAWLAAQKEKLSQRLKIDASELRFSAAKQWVAFLRGPAEPPPAAKPKPPPRHPPPRQYQIIVTDLEGKERDHFRPLAAATGDEPPKDLRFLAEDKLVYEVVAPPPPPPGSEKHPAKKKAPPRRPPAHKAGPAAPPPLPPGPPPRLFVIQPLTTKPARRARPIRCEGIHFAFNPRQDHLVFVSGKPEAGYVAVDGVAVYPRRGRTVIASEPAWSKDGMALAFLETPSSAPSRLVLLAEFDNPTGDTTWPLPPAAHLEGSRVFWAGMGKLVVGKTALHPIFATSFSRGDRRTWDP